MLGLRLRDFVRQRTDDADPPELPLSMQFNPGESAMWRSNARNNFAPFAGFMLMAYEKRGPLERAGEEIHEAVENVRQGDETPGNKIDDVPL